MHLKSCEPSTFSSQELVTVKNGRDKAAHATPLLYRDDTKIDRLDQAKLS